MQDAKAITVPPPQMAAITAAVLLLTLWGTRYYGRHAGMAQTPPAGALASSRSDA
jgi:DHA1 family inner membrane transport protein